MKWFPRSVLKHGLKRNVQRFSPSIIHLVQQRWKTWKTWNGQSLVALRGELSDKPEEWRSFGIRIASIDELNDPQIYASACDSFVNEGSYRIGVSCSFCYTGTTAIVCANDTCHRSCCPMCYTHQSFGAAVTIPLPLIGDETWRCCICEPRSVADHNMIDKWSRTPKHATLFYSDFIYDLKEDVVRVRLHIHICYLLHGSYIVL
jgi:hypothetical protein